MLSPILRVLLFTIPSNVSTQTMNPLKSALMAAWALEDNLCSNRKSNILKSSNCHRCQLCRSPHGNSRSNYETTAGISNNSMLEEYYFRKRNTSPEKANTLHFPVYLIHLNCKFCSFLSFHPELTEYPNRVHFRHLLVIQT